MNLDHASVFEVRFSSRDRLFSRCHLILLLASLTGFGCREARVAPSVVYTDSAGISIATLVHMPAIDDAGFEWTLTPLRSLRTASKDPTADPVLFEPRRLARLDDRTIVALDSSEPHLAVIDFEEGNVLRRFGRTGQGPGEISDRIALLWTESDGSIVVADRVNSRITKFTEDGRVSSVSSLRPLERASGVGDWHVVPESGEVYGQIWSVSDFETNALTDSLARLDQDSGEFRVYMPFPPRAPASGQGGTPLFSPHHLLAVLPSGESIVGSSDAAVFRHHDREGVVLRELRVPLTRRPVTEAERTEILDEFQSSVRGSTSRSAPEIGSHYPISNIIWALNDSVFVLQHTRRSLPAGDPLLEEGQSAWRMLSTSGHYLGAVRLPNRFLPMWFGGDRVMGVARDERGVAVIEEFELTPPRIGR